MFDRQNTNREALLTIAAIFVFVINSYISVYYISLEMQSIGDVIRGWRQFNELLGSAGFYFDRHNSDDLRLGMAFITVFLMLFLRATGLVEREVFLIYLLLPVTAYLSTKVKLEFLIFPLAVIRIGMGLRKELAVLLILALIGFLIKENNVLIIILYRILRMVDHKLHLSFRLTLMILASILVMDYLFSVVSGYIPSLQIYNHTREVVNPEYTVLETIVVFFSSSVASVQPQYDYMVGLAATALIAFPTVLFWIKNRRNPTGVAIDRKTDSDIGGLYSLMIVVFFFTSITHAFQNARYYLFYIQSLSPFLRNSSMKILFFSSNLIMLGLAIFYKVSDISF